MRTLLSWFQESNWFKNFFLETVFKINSSVYVVLCNFPCPTPTVTWNNIYFLTFEQACWVKRKNNFHQGCQEIGVADRNITGCSQSPPSRQYDRALRRFIFYDNNLYEGAQKNWWLLTKIVTIIKVTAISQIHGAKFISLYSFFPVLFLSLFISPINIFFL